MLSGRYLTLALLGLSLGTASRALAANPPTWGDLATLRTITYVQLSPDGSRIAFVMSGEVWAGAARPGSAPKAVGKGSLPAWSPDGSRLAFYSSQSGSQQLWTWDAKSAKAAQATAVTGGISPDPRTRQSGSVTDLLRVSWSPDGEKLVFASRAESATAKALSSTPDFQPADAAAGRPLVLTNTTPASWTLSGVFTTAFGKPPEQSTLPKVLVSQLFVADLQSKSVRQLTTDDGVYFEPAWSADGRAVICSSAEGRDPWLGPLNLYAIDPATGAKRALTTGAGDKRMARPSPDGKWIAYAGGAHFDKASIFVLPAAGLAPGAAAENAAATVQRFIIDFAWMPDSQSLALTAWDAVDWPILRVPIGGAAERMTNGAAQRSSFSVAKDGALAWTQGDGSHASAIYERTADGRVEELFDPNPQMHAWALGEQEVIRWKNSRGQELEGVLIKPVGYEPGKRYPMIVDGYNSQPNGFKSFQMMGNQLWAAQGYAVFWPVARAPHTWMDAYRDDVFDHEAQGPKGIDALLDDAMSGIDEVIRRGIADPGRLGLHGFSNGGGAVGYLVTHSERFKCAVWASGVYPDWITPALLQTDSTLATFEGGANVWDEPETYVKLSAVYQLKNLTTPMLLAVGDDDGYFLLGALEFYNSLRAQHKEVTLLRYAGQGHGFSGNALKDFAGRESAFFARYLKGDGGK